MNPSELLVSVIVPTYNAEKTIADTISSILCQSFSNLELIIIDDGSTDNTAEIVHKFNDNRINYVYQTNQERAETRNHGIALAQGELIAFVDSDDIWLFNKLEKQLDVIKNNPDIGLIYCDLIHFDDETGRELFRFSNKVNLRRGNNCIKAILRDNFIQSPTPIVRKDIFDKLGLFDSSLIPVEDWDMWIRIASMYEIEVVNEPLACYRVHQKHTSWKNKPDLLYNSTLKMFEKIEKTLILEDPSLNHTLQKCRSLAHYNYATAMMDKHQLNKSFDYYRLAIKSNPWMIKVYIRLLQLLHLRVFGQLSRFVS